MAGPGDRQRLLEGGAKNGVNDDVRVAKRFSRRATHIFVQRQYRNTARAESSNHGHSSADRARLHLGLLVLLAPACNKYSANEFGHRIWALERLRPQMQPLNLWMA